MRCQKVCAYTVDNTGKYVSRNIKSKTRLHILLFGKTNMHKRSVIRDEKIENVAEFVFFG